VYPSSSWKQIGNRNLSVRKFLHVEIFFADFAESPDLIRTRRLSVFIGVCPSLSQSILVYRGSQIGVYRWPKLPSWPAFCSPIDTDEHRWTRKD